MFVKNFKFMENYNSWKIYLQVKMLTLVIFTHMPPPPSPPPPLPHIVPANSPPGSIITSQATMTLNIRLFLFYMICNFFRKICKYIAFCHIAW